MLQAIHTTYNSSTNEKQSDTPEASDFRGAFDVSTFARSIQIALEKTCQQLRSNAVEGVTLEDPRRLMAEARGLMSEPGNPTSFDPDRFAAILDLYLRTAIKVSSTGYMARQFSSVVPISATFDLVSAIVPQPASFYEAGQLANVADKIIAEEFGRLIGWRSGQFDMITTSGGSLANLTTILAARNNWHANSWTKGINGMDSRPLAIAVGDDVHYSVARVPGIIGIGSDNIIRLPLNDRRQICPIRAAEALKEAEANGRDVFCMVASAGSTAVGAIDPLEELADLAKRHGIWLHVDAAHSGAFLVSDTLRPRLKGLERANSFCLDAHKTLFVPGLCTLLFYRDKAAAKTAFAQKASYVFDDETDPMVQFESGAKNFECTKRPAILNLWLVWSMYGRSLFADKLDYLVGLTRDIHRHIRGQPDFKVAHEPESNILCFEYCPAGLDASATSALQLELRDRIRAEGQFFVSKVQIDGRNVLRVVMMNHAITLDHAVALTDEIRRIGAEIIAEWNSAIPLKRFVGHGR